MKTSTNGISRTKMCYLASFTLCNISQYSIFNIRDLPQMRIFHVHVRNMLLIETRSSATSIQRIFGYMHEIVQIHAVSWSIEFARRDRRVIAYQWSRSRFYYLLEPTRVTNLRILLLFGSTKVINVCFLIAVCLTWAVISTAVMLKGITWKNYWLKRIVSFVHKH